MITDYAEIITHRYIYIYMKCLLKLMKVAVTSQLQSHTTNTHALCNSSHLVQHPHKTNTSYPRLVYQVYISIQLFVCRNTYIYIDTHIYISNKHYTQRYVTHTVLPTQLHRVNVGVRVEQIVAVRLPAEEEVRIRVGVS